MKTAIMVSLIILALIWVCSDIECRVHIVMDPNEMSFKLGFVEADANAPDISIKGRIRIESKDSRDLPVH